MSYLANSLDPTAPEDVRRTTDWLEVEGFALVEDDTERGPFGSYWVFVGGSTEIRIRVVVDRGQWWLDVGPFQFDLLVAAQRGQDYRECFPRSGEPPRPLPEQLPDGISWRETLPTVLDWMVECDDVGADVQRAEDQRYVQMWPESPKAKQLLRAWRNSKDQTHDQGKA